MSARRATCFERFSVTGGFRSPSVLNKPFADVAEIIGLGKRFTQKGLRRTFNDLMRTERVENVVRNSIAGWASDRMPDRIYPTVAADEQRSAIGKLAEVIDLGAVRGSAQSGSAQGSAHAPTAVHGNEKAG